MKPSKEILEQAEREFQEAQKHSKPDDYVKLTTAELTEFQPVGHDMRRTEKIMKERRANGACKGGIQCQQTKKADRQSTGKNTVKE